MMYAGGGGGGGGGGLNSETGTTVKIKKKNKGKAPYRTTSQKSLRNSFLSFRECEKFRYLKIEALTLVFKPLT